MAQLTSTSGGPSALLKAQTLIGRSKTCDVLLSEALASGQHALIRWTGAGWELRDLGSRNGTYVNERLLPAGERISIVAGTRIGFGRPDEVWVLASDDPPVATARSGEEVVLEQGGMLTLPPGESSPIATVYRRSDGTWVVETDDGVVPAVSELSVAGRIWILTLPEATEGTLQLDHLSLSRSTLRFEVSSDEETIHIRIIRGDVVRTLPDRSHHYLLLTLARQRLEDRQEGYSPEEEGWTDFEMLADGLRLEPTHINVQIYRARRQLASEGIADAAHIVERRSLAGQLRLGAGDIEVVRF